jgi:SAM-dependent methyltransferase
MHSAIERWHALLDERARQMDAAYARLGRTSADFWDRRAKGYHRSTRDTVTGDPFYTRLLSTVTPQTSILDVGAGTGRFALALASRANYVTAVEPNTAMSQIMRQEMLARGISNVTIIPTIWQDAPTSLHADIVACSHVLYPIREVDTFIAKLLAATHRTCFIYMRALHFDQVTAPLWQHFHGDRRHLPPSYIHALDVMFEMGLYANVEIVTMPNTMRYPSLDIAVTEMLEQLILPDDDNTQTELRRLLEPWLIEQNGMLTPPAQKFASAIITISPNQADRS